MRASFSRLSLTLVKYSYLRKNIPCSCLDKKYKEVKSITRMGMCCNEMCSLPNQMAKRSTMLCCTGCRVANYCSRECQKAAWPENKEFCERLRSIVEVDDEKKMSKISESKQGASQVRLWLAVMIVLLFTAANWH